MLGLHWAGANSTLRPIRRLTTGVTTRMCRAELRRERTSRVQLMRSARRDRPVESVEAVEDGETEDAAPSEPLKWSRASRKAAASSWDIALVGGIAQAEAAASGVAAVEEVGDSDLSVASPLGALLARPLSSTRASSRIFLAAVLVRFRLA